MNIIAELLQAVFFLAEGQKKELCYNPEDGTIYRVTQRGKENVTLLPLHGADAPIVDFNPDKLIFQRDIAERSEFISPYTDLDSNERGEKQRDVQVANGIVIGSGQEDRSSQSENYGTPTDKAKAFIGIGKVDLPRFSVLYTGETAKLSVRIEDLLDKIFSATNKQQTIETSIADYENAKKCAKGGQIYELKQLAERLQGRINKQAAIQNAKDTMAAQAAARKKMIFSAVAVVVIALLYFGITHFYKNMPSVQTETEICPITDIDSRIFFLAKENKVEMYPYRVDKIKAEIQKSGDNSLQNIDFIIKKNIVELKEYLSK